MRYRFHTADVFTAQIFGGNPLAVFPAARGLDGAVMQRIARELNLSETVFVLPPEDARNTRKLRIFTPATELPFAGHPTVGTAFVLAAIGDLALDGEETAIVFEEGVGPVPVSIRAQEGRPVFAQLSVAKAPELGPAPPPVDAIAAALSLDTFHLLQGEHAPQAWSCGVPFLFVPVRDLAALARARIDMSRWQAVLASYWAPSPFVFVPGEPLRARMFAPAMGVAEDPATGAAAAALAGYLGTREAADDCTCLWTIEQGVEMGRPSRIELEADKSEGRIVAVRVGGAAVLVSEGTFEVPR